MKPKISFFLIIPVFLIMVTGCNKSNESTINIPTATITPSSTFTSTPPPTQTPLPPIILDYYHLQFEYTNTSDWATLEILNPEEILTIKVSSVNGTPTTASATSTSIQLIRPYEALEAEPSVSMKIDILIDPEYIDQPLSILSKHGGIGGSGIKIFYIANNETISLQEIDHFWTDLTNPGTNDKLYEINLSPLKSIAPIHREIPRTSPPKMLWAIYYPWIAWDQLAACTDHPATSYAYNADGSRTVETFTRQITEAKSVGIDGFLVSWLDGEILNKNLALMLQTANEMDFKIAIYLESTPDPNDRSVHPDEIKNWLTYAISTFGNEPAYMNIDGKPLIIIYNSGAASLDIWEGIFNDLEKNGVSGAYMGMGYNLTDLDVFLGLHQYAIMDIPDLAGTYQSVSRGIHNYSLLSDANTQKIFAATVQTGFDSCPYDPDSTTFVDRNSGEYYKTTFNAAIASNPDWIFITTWNEFGENTHIESSEKYGTQYLDITKEYALLWKGQ